MDPQREAIGLLQALDADAEARERGDEGRDGALAHPRHPVDLVDAAAEGHHDGQKARRGAGVADEALRVRRGHHPGDAAHAEGVRGLVGVDADPERPERLRHEARVVAEEGAGELRVAAREGREDERAVRAQLFEPTTSTCASTARSKGTIRRSSLMWREPSTARPALARA